MDLPIKNNIILEEMLCHPPLFAHSNPQKVLLISQEPAPLLQHVLKHKSITDVWVVGKKLTSKDKRIHFKEPAWLQKAEGDFFDIIINRNPPLLDQIGSLFQRLKTGGILTQFAYSPFQLSLLKKLQQNFYKQGFADVQIMSFPQPQSETGWQAAVIGMKDGIFRKVREQDIFNRTFTTHYYNLDVHKASLVLPQFMREELEC